MPKKGRTMNDLVKGTNANFFPMQKVPIIEGKADNKVLLEDINTDRLVQTIEAQKEYNKNITNLDTRYKELLPLSNNLILRAFVREGKVTETGLILGTEKAGVDTIPVFTRGSSGDQYRSKSVPNPFKFMKKAVVVSVNEHENQIKPGDIVGIPVIKGGADQDQEGTWIALDYNFSFIHPDVDRTHPPTDLKDPDYGYLRMARTTLTVLMKNEN